MARLLALTDCTLLRAGFEALVADEPEFELLPHPSRIREDLLAIEAVRPDIVVIDYGLEGSLALCHQLTSRNSKLPVLILSATLDDEAVRGSIAAGARGFAYKDIDREELRTAMKRLAAGESFLDPRVAGRVIAWATQQPIESGNGSLSHRETEVLRHVARGEPNKRIARRLGLSENTVKTYLRRAYKKLDCHTRSAAAAMVSRRGLL